MTDTFRCRLLRGKIKVSLRVLITNNTLGVRAGSELYVRDIAIALLAKGHTPIAYSTQLGDVAEDLRLATIPVVDDLSQLAEPPDIIHGQHHLDTMTALLHFPGVPCIYFCHGWLPWEEAPPQFPRIRQYVCVDYTCRDRLLYEHAIASERIEVLLNFVDLDRFQPRSTPLSPKPQRALVFSNAASHPDYLREVQAACDRFGIALDVVGLGAGVSCAKPEKILAQYDLIFAKARAALESMAVGAAVILHDATGTGEMLTTENFAQFRQFNFGIRSFQKPITVEGLVQEIARYDPLDAAKVSQHVRQTAGRDAVVSRIIQLYEKVLQQEPTLAKHDLESESRAASVYFRWLAPRLKQFYLYDSKLAQRQEQISHYEAQLLQSSLTNEQRQQALVQSQQHCHNLEAALEQARSQRQQAQIALEQLKVQLDWVETSNFWKLRGFYMQCKRWVMLTLRLKLDADQTR